MKAPSSVNDRLLERQLHCARCDERRKLGLEGMCSVHAGFPSATDPRLQQPQLPALHRQAGLTKPEKDEIKNFALEFFRSDEYKENLKTRILAGKADHMELKLLAHAYGEPVKKIEIVENPIAAELQGASMDVLAERVETLRRVVEVMKTLEDSQPLTIDVEASSHESSPEQTKSSEAA